MTWHLPGMDIEGSADAIAVQYQAALDDIGQTLSIVKGDASWFLPGLSLVDWLDEQWGGQAEQMAPLMNEIRRLQAAWAAANQAGSDAQRQAVADDAMRVARAARAAYLNESGSDVKGELSYWGSVEDVDGEAIVETYEGAANAVGDAAEAAGDALANAAGAASSAFKGLLAVVALVAVAVIVLEVKD